MNERVINELTLRIDKMERRMKTESDLTQAMLQILLAETKWTPEEISRQLKSILGRPKPVVSVSVKLETDPKTGESRYVRD